MLQVRILIRFKADWCTSSTQVEKAPTVVKAGLKKEEAEELKKKLEAGTTYTPRQCTHYMLKVAIHVEVAPSYLAL